MIYKAQVVDARDVTQEGRFRVFCPEIEEDFFEVIYVSPYYRSAEGGFIALPERGSEVLISQLENDSNWYFMGSIVNRKEGVEETDDPDIDILMNRNVLPPVGIYNSDNIPQKVIWKTPLGHCITLSDQYDVTKNNVKVEIKSSLGKKILLADSPGLGCIWLRNESGDGIQIVSEDSTDLPGRSILLSSKGYQVLTSQEAEVKLRVVDGQDIHIRNTSTGANTLPGSRERTGNVNIESKYRDINITAENNTGRIFLNAGDKIQLECRDGEIIIHSAQKISLSSDGDINIKAANNLKLEATNGNVDIKGRNIAALAQQGATIEGQSSANLTGGNTYLGEPSPGKVTPGDNDPTEPVPNNYGV